MNLDATLTADAVIASLHPLVAAGFIHPAIAAGTAAAAVIPLLIHLINRRRHKKVPWAAMNFLLAANQRSLNRVRFEHWVLLAMRTAVIVLLGLALARPFTQGGTLLGLGDTVQHRILLIDDSLSASITSGDAEAAQLIPAAEAALDLLDAFPPRDAVSVITLGGQADPLIGQAAYDRRSIRDQIANIQSTQQGTDLVGGLRLASGIIEESPTSPQNRVVYVISDQAATAWNNAREQGTSGTVKAAVRVAERAQLAIVPTSNQSRSNLAITRFVCDQDLPGINQPIRLRATVSNFGNTPAHPGDLQLRRKGRITRRIPIQPIPPGQDIELTFSTSLSSAGIHPLELRIVPQGEDSLHADDARFLSLEAFESVSVLLVDGQPSADRFSGETGYLATALSPKLRPSDAGLLSPKTITELELSGEVLEDHRLIVLCNVQRLDETMWQRLAGYVRDGGGLFVFLGDVVNPDNYNKTNEFQDGGLLPCRIGQFAGDAADRENFVRLKSEVFKHSAVVDFSGTEKSGLFLNGRIYQHYVVQPLPSATVMMRYTNDLPAIVERSLGLGKVCMVTTSANMAWNNLAARGDFVSLMLNLCSYLAEDASVRRDVLVGDVLSEPLPVSLASQPLSVSAPGGRTDKASIDVDQTGYVLKYGPTTESGIYEVAAGQARWPYAVNIIANESDLRTLSHADIKEMLKCPFSYLPDWRQSNEISANNASAELAAVMQYVVLMLLVAEGWLAMRFSSRR